jgi:hypothetical protein
MLASSQHAGPDFAKILSSTEPLKRVRHSGVVVAFPIKVCVTCGEEFELKPEKPGFANRCPECSEPDADGSDEHSPSSDSRELNDARRQAMRDLLYRKDS